MSDDPETYLAVLKAAYDYEPQPDADDELAVKEGQILFLVERVDDDWWKIKPKQGDDAPAGLVPAAYVEQHEHTSVVKALYDYDAANPGELTIKVDEILYVYDKDDAWLLVHSQKPGGRVGFVPETYVEEVGEGSASAAPVIPSIPNIVVPPSLPRPVSTYVDPADRVAATANKAKADDIQTWSVSEIDKKGKKKKGTLGIGSGAVFFTSESDKAPVQKWQTAHLASTQIDKDKSRHVLIEIGGPNPASLHFNAGSKDTADAIVKKLEISKQLSAPPEALEEPIAPPERPRSAAKTVHFDAAAPAIIPDPDDTDEEEPENGGSQDYDPNAAVVLYDFAADGDDELTVTEGEDLIVIERDSDDWWKVRNSKGREGVLRNPSAADGAARKEHEAELEAEQEAEAQAAAEEERRQKEEAEEAAKKERAKEAARRAEAVAAADKKRRDKERAEREKEKKMQEQDKELTAQGEDKKLQSSSGSKSNGDVDPPRPSTDRRPPPGNKTRIWHDRTGQFRVEAAFLGYQNRKLRLHKVNGVVIEVPAEKMSAEDMRYVEKITASQNKRSSESPPGPRSGSDDDEPLATRRNSLRLSAKTTQQPQKKPQVDWFEFFLSAGCDVDDCTRYASAFERDKIDEAILGDITEGTMRSLGLREGDIIRVKKHIETSKPKAIGSKDDSAQIQSDEELARRLQEEENSGSKRSPAPNLFAGPNGALKNNTQRRGRPVPSKSLPPTSVDADAISSASETIKRTGSPSLLSPSSSPSQGPTRAGSVPPISSGFDDDAWTNRPSSAKPLTPTPAPPVQPQPPRTASAPPQSHVEPPAAPTIVETKSAPAPQLQQTGGTGSGLTKTTEEDVFNQLARLASLRTQSPAVTSPSPQPQRPVVANNPSPSPVVISPPPGFGSGMGVGGSPMPIGQLQSSGLSLQPQLTAVPNINGPRGPFAPVPANQGLLQPLVPTRTGFTGFVPTGPSNNLGTNNLVGGMGGGLQPQQSILPPQTGFVSPPVIPSPTGFPTSNLVQAQGFLPQQTGFPNMGGFQTPSPAPPVPPMPPLLNFQSPGVMSNPTGFPGGGPGFGGVGGFGGVQSNPTGFPGMVGGMIPFNPQPPQNQNNTAPANVFAQMKAGTFAQGNDSTAQPANKYDALRANPLAAQPTGWFPGPSAYGSF
ncbi:hypothetical protein BDM02DRAFT_3186395 [Thelephora ganbajun]|uniref:Uncharacterized protein n=1 Tax=Thelephora ganbajun TaxID=370292 RepID=A0ACB6ZHT7_THEGA|nr:hypothetical protein BDM02DRAFT_3186395 [Thelephora ganbajun]